MGFTPALYRHILWQRLHGPLPNGTLGKDNNNNNTVGNWTLAYCFCPEMKGLASNP